MARGCVKFVLLALLLSSEFSQCSSDDQDSFIWNVKDNTKFGVAESNIEVNSLVFSVFYRDFIRVDFNR